MSICFVNILAKGVIYIKNNYNLIECMVDDVEYATKPESEEVRRIQCRLKAKSVSIKDLALRVSIGQTFRPAVLDSRSANSWRQQQLFALDFDSGTTIDNELQRAETFGLKPNIIYKTFSHTEEHPKFRMVFCFDKPIADSALRDKIQHKIGGLFPNSDSKCMNADRLFFGGKELVKLNDSHFTNFEWFESTFSLDTGEAFRGKKPIGYCEQKVPISFEIDKEYLDKQIIAIRSLNICEKKSVQKDNMGTDMKINIYNSSQYIHIKDLVATPQCVANCQELYKLLMRIDLSEYLGVHIGTKMRCILPDHEDAKPSAHIYISDDGTQLYKCFGCDDALNIVQLTMRLANCRKTTAVKFISGLYNIKLKESEWIMDQKRQIDAFRHIIYLKQFQDTLPNLSIVLGRRKKYLEKMLDFIYDNIKDDLIVGDYPVVFASYDTLMTHFGIRKREIVAQSILLFTLLGLIVKVPISQIPKQYMETTIEIQRKHRHHKTTNYYQMGDFGISNLNKADAMARVLKEKGMTYKGLTREFVYRTFGQEAADRCFPQYKRENAIGMSTKSDDAVISIAIFINKRIKKQGYCLVKEITLNKKYDLQWRKAIAEILESYGWQKRKLNKELKEKFKVNAKGYPQVIIND